MKTLIFRSAPMKRFEDALEKIRSEFGKDALVGVVTHVSTTPEMIDHNPLELFNYFGKKMNAFSLGLKNIIRIRNEKFDRVVILCVNHLGDGYEQIKFAALLTGVKNIELWNVKGQKISVTWFSFFKETVVWNLSLCFYAVIWFCLFVSNKLRKSVDAHRN